MDTEQIRTLVLQMKDVTEGFPFGESTLVFKVNNKIFLLIGLDTEVPSFNVKCEPEKAVQLREEYVDSIIPGYHMNKKHWNTVLFEKLPNALLIEMINDSYKLVAKKKK